jgi:uncharacterized protein YhaN
MVEETAETKWKDWTTQWASALKAFQLPAMLTPKTADAQINAIDDMREAAGRINDLRHERIEKIERDIRAFEQGVAALVRAVAPQLTEMDAEDAVLDLEGLVTEAKCIRDVAVAKETALGRLQKKIDECHESCRDARDVIGRLQAAAHVEAIDALRTAIRRSDDMRRLQTELDRLTDAVAQDGDGLSIAALSDECAATDLDAIAAKEQTVTQEVEELRERGLWKRARTEAMPGGNSKPSAAMTARRGALPIDRQRSPKSRRSPDLLLQWAIDRYRCEKQAPMLKRAGELFAILTGGSFQTLQLEFDADDNVELAGIRQDGRRVAVAGMSDGTMDQLYLALRSRRSRTMPSRCRSSRTTCSSTSMTSARRRASGS